VASPPIHRPIDAPPPAVYRALLDADAVGRWRVPEGMSSTVHEFDGRPSRRFRISLTYRDQPGRGKTTDRTDTFHGYFSQLVPDREVVEVIEFETTDPDLVAEFTVTTTLEATDGGTRVTVVFEGLPPGVPADDNVEGTRMGPARLATLVEGR